MGFDLSLFMVNLFLHHYEDKCLLDTKKGDLHKARLFNDMFGFIDNLCSISNRLEFDRNFGNMYPSEPEA